MTSLKSRDVHELKGRTHACIESIDQVIFSKTNHDTHILVVSATYGVLVLKVAVIVFLLIPYRFSRQMYRFDSSTSASASASTSTTSSSFRGGSSSCWKGRTRAPTSLLVLSVWYLVLGVCHRTGMVTAQETKTASPSSSSTSLSESAGTRFANRGGPPDAQGAWIGLDNWGGFVVPSGAFFTFVSPQENGESWAPVIGQLRFLSWECTGNEGESVTEFEQLVVNPNGTVVSSGRKCALYRIDLERQTQFVKYDRDCETIRSSFVPERQSLEKDSFINFRLNSSVVAAPTSLVCVAGANETGQDTSGGPSYTGDLLEVGTSLGDATPPIPYGSTFPPSFSESIGRPFLNGYYYSTEANLLASVLGNVYASVSYQNGTFVNEVGRFSGFDELSEKEYASSWTKSQITTDGTVTGTVAVCGVFVAPTAYVFLVSDNTLAGLNNTCPTPQDATVALNRLYFIPTRGYIKTGIASATDLDGAKQVPPITNNTATANFRLERANDQGFFTFDLDITDIEGFTMAHIHQGNGSFNGPVVVDLIPSQSHWPTPIDTTDTLPMFSTPVSGDFQFNGAFSQDDFQGPLENASMSEFIAGLSDSGNYYVNVHTEKHPQGAIRAQLSLNRRTNDSVSPDTSTAMVMSVHVPVLLLLLCL